MATGIVKYTHGQAHLSLRSIRSRHDIKLLTARGKYQCQVSLVDACTVLKFKTGESNEFALFWRGIFIFQFFGFLSLQNLSILGRVLEMKSIKDFI